MTVWLVWSCRHRRRTALSGAVIRQDVDCRIAANSADARRIAVTSGASASDFTAGHTTGFAAGARDTSMLYIHPSISATETTCSPTRAKWRSNVARVNEVRW